MFENWQAFNITQTLKKDLIDTPEKEATMKKNNFYWYLLNSTARIYYLVWKDMTLEEKPCHYFGYLNRVIMCRYHRL